MQHTFVLSVYILIALLYPTSTFIQSTYIFICISLSKLIERVLLADMKKDEKVPRGKVNETQLHVFKRQLKDLMNEKHNYMS